jgi:penicillin-binding protein 1C
VINVQKNFRKRILISAGIALLIVFYFSLPKNLFNVPFSTTIEDVQGNLLGARISSDGQWRFPPVAEVPEKLKICIINFEDQYFFRHPGFNPASLARAFYQNITSGEIKSGGSTITMQVIRIYRKNKHRTYVEKLREIILSVRLELKFTKNDILSLYASYAPYGSNIIGTEAASWRYFKRKPDDLSWSEAALLAVLPNQPGLIFPGQNSLKLAEKRNRLLKKLLDRHLIDRLTFELSVKEPVPSAPEPLPSLAPQFLTRAIKEGKTGQRVRTTLQRNLQIAAANLVERHAVKFRSRQVYNAAAIIMEINTGKVLAYVGNTTPDPNSGEEQGNEVDIITSPRSTGSILKPFLFAAMIDEGTLLPSQLIPDVPTLIDGFAPKNFSRTFDGAVPANEVIGRSLNVPAVYLLRDYRYERFHYFLKKLGMTTLKKPAGHYGLSLILGGAESTLWDIGGMYGSLARELNHYFIFTSPLKYNSTDIHQPVIYLNDTIQNNHSGNIVSGLVNAGPIWIMLHAMSEISRPEEDASWRYYGSGRRVAWKTGTSFGNRDAWSVGFDRDYLVGVWVGNADGEGRAGLTGGEFAAPLMFDLFNLLPRGSWFEKPGSDLKEIEVCSKSGFRASRDCEHIVRVESSLNGMKAPQCNFCKLVFLDQTGRYRVNADCERTENMTRKSWFVLPPVQEWYFKSRDPFYKILPPFRKNCAFSGNPIPAMALIYPKNYSKIYVPHELTGQPGRSIFEVAHRNPSTTIYWHVDNEYIGMTRNIHQMGIASGTGIHSLVLVDENGETLKIRFEVISGNQ